MGLLLILVALYPVVTVALIVATVRPASSALPLTLLLAICLMVFGSWFIGRADEVLWEGIVSGIASMVAIVALQRIRSGSRALRSPELADRRSPRSTTPRASR